MAYPLVKCGRPLHPEAPGYVICIHCLHRDVPVASFEPATQKELGQITCRKKRHSIEEGILICAFCAQDGGFLPPGHQIVSNRRNPESASLKKLKKELQELEVDAARGVVSLATYLRVSLFLRTEHQEHDKDLLKELTSLGSYLDIFNNTGLFTSELGYPVFKYLESNKDDTISPIFITFMEDPPHGGKDFTYWRPSRAIGVEEKAYCPWATPEHLTLLRTYPLTAKDLEVMAYHLRGPLDNSPGILEGLEPIYQRIQNLKQEYLKAGGVEWEEHLHTKQLPVMIDLLNEYLATNITVPTDQVWLQRSEKAPISSQSGRRASSRKKKPKQKESNIEKGEIEDDDEQEFLEDLEQLDENDEDW